MKKAKDSSMSGYKHVEEYGDAIITAEDIQTNPVLYWDIISLAMKDFNVSWAFVSRKLLMFREWWKYYTKPDVYRDQIIKIHYARQQIEAFKSTFFDNNLSVKFGAYELGDDELGYRLDKMAEYDYKVMKKNVTDWRILDNIGFYWVGLELKRWYNPVTQTPIIDVVNPEARLPDVLGDVVKDNREYHMFIVKTTVYSLLKANELEPGTYFNLDQISTGAFWEYEYQEYIKKTQRLLSTFEDYRRNIRTTIYYKIINGRKYLIELCNNNSVIVRFEALPCVTKEEVENPTLVPRPVVVHCMCPVEGDPFGMGIMELTLDKQNAINTLSNLALLKEQRNAGFDNYLVDMNVIQNPSLLSKRPLAWPNFIPAKTINWQPITNAIAPVLERPVASDTMAMIDRINMEWQFETNFTSANRGLTPGAQTLWQSKQMQLNSNILFGATANVLSWGILSFWRDVYYRTLVENLSKSEKKIVKVSHGIGTTDIELDREDILNGIPTRIRIENKKDVDEKNKEILSYMEAREPAIMGDPNIPQISKLIFKRKMDELSGVSREMMFVNSPLTPDEYRVRKYVPAINANYTPKNLFKPWMDYYTYWLYISWCKDTEVKRKILDQLEQAMIDEWLNMPKEIPMDMQWMMNSMGSQKTSARIAQQQTPQVPSLQNIKQ